VGYQIEGIGLEKTFAERRSIRKMIRNPLEPARKTRALRGVDLAIREGEIFGLLGPNGAGKTTLIKIFCCLVLPDAGQARVSGFDVAQDEGAVKSRIGLVHSDERSFYWRLSARQNLRFFARLYDVPPKRIESRIRELLDHVGMTEAADRPFSGYSSGMKQKIAIARALLHDPPILFMDEPTRSLDPASAKELREFIHDQLKLQDGKTIILATHNLREAELLSDRLAVLVKGKVRQVGTVNEVRRWGITEERYVIETDSGERKLEGPFRILDDEVHDGVRRVTVAPDPGRELGHVLRALLDSGCSIQACDRVDPDLEDAFSRILESSEASS